MTQYQESAKQRTPFSNENNRLRELDRTVVWHAFSQMESYDGLIIDHAEGCWLVDIEGKRFLDGASSLWCNIHGHCNPVINQAIRNQLEKVGHVTGLGMSHPETIRLAKRLVDLSPPSLQHVFFCSDGASAVEVAIKIAFQYWQQSEPPEPGRTQYLAIGNAYHGDTIGTVALGGVEQFHAQFKPLLFPVVRGTCPKGHRSVSLAMPQGTQESQEDLCKDYLRQYRLILEEHADTIAALVVEPLLQCSAGMVFHPPGFLAGIGELCKEFGVLLIVDEIAVGTGRTGRLFASDLESVQPDMLCLGKGLTGGYLPMSAALVSTRIFNAFLGDETKTLYHGHTYGGNPLAAAASNASLDLTLALLESDSWQERVEQLENGLKKLAKFDDVVRADQLGMLATIELRSNQDETSDRMDGDRCEPITSRSVCRDALERGVWLRPLGNCIPIVPPLSISETELELLLESLEYGLDPTRKVL